MIKEKESFMNSVADPCHFGRYGSGSADPYFWLTDPDPAIFAVTFEMATKHFLSL
jgi:hypothetical protein